MVSQRFGIDVQTVFGMPPVEHVNLAADLGCAHIGAALTPVPWRLNRFPAWSLREDAGLRKATLAAMRDRGIALLQAEGFSVRPTVDARSYAADLDLFAQLGARQASGVCMERDRPRALEQLAVLADLTAERGMGFSLEFAPPHAINNLSDAVATIKLLGRANVRLVIDAMHFFRTGGSLDELRALSPDLIGYVQLCDVPKTPPHDDYLREACFQRLIPGDGELPLAELCAAIPNGVAIGLEVPMQVPTEQPGKLETLVSRAVEATRRLLEASQGLHKH